MISRFFIDRPIFATVLSILLVLAGGVAVFNLAVAQYPEVTPPTVVVTALYPGANAKTVSEAVAAPIEQQVNGVEDMLYMSSQCTNDGLYSLTVTFALGTNLNMAQVLVQNRVSLALPVLPSQVQRQGVSVKKKSPSTMMIINLTSDVDPNTGQPRYDDLYLSNYAMVQLKDELARLPGVGDVAFLGQRDYSMRVWLDPEKMTTRSLSAEQVVQAIEKQNAQVAAGQIGQQPVPAGQAFQLTISTLGQLATPEQFADIIVKTSADTQNGSDTSDPANTQKNGGTPGNTADTSTSVGIVRLRDVARIELGSQQYDQSCTLDGQPSVALSIYQLPGSNALQTADAVVRKMDQLKQRFPEGVDYAIVYNTTPFIRESIGEVFHTLRDAIILVALVVLVFLQNWRATLIPLAAVPVAIVGTFAFILAVGFSLNNLTLFGLVLAIGIVVDDAIVVVENVERWLEEGYTPKEAARKAMDEVTGPVVAIALVLCAVFVPCAFITGITGQFFRQFAVTIAVSTVLSAINSLTLSPALAALLLKPRHAPPDGFQWLLNLVFGWFFVLFNGAFRVGTAAYGRAVGGLLRVAVLVLVLYGGLLYLTYHTFTVAPAGFIPDQDKGYLLVNVQLPDAASVERTREVMAKIDGLCRQVPGVAHTVGISGQSLILNANASNFGSLYVMLKPFDERHGASQGGDAIAATLRARFRTEIRTALVDVYGAPPIDGLGTASGFKVMVEDRGNLGPAALQQAADKLVTLGAKTPGLEGMSTSLRMNTPWLYLDIDRDKVAAQGISLDDVFTALQVYLGSYYVNNFTEFGRTWQVNVMADPHFRFRIENIRLLQVRNSSGEMVPLGSFATPRMVGGPVLLTRYNMYPAAAVTGRTAPGVGSGDVVPLVEQAAEQLPPAVATEWTELTFLQVEAGSTAMIVFVLAVLLVFLVLAAQYESWSLPLAVILVVPMCLLCSIGGVLLAGMDVNIFTQIGFVVLVGLASKNAILIVEFARQLREQGKPLREATVEASMLRLRPILMTSFAFILGVVPLVIAEGAGAEMRRTLGVAVFAGMLGVTIFGIFLTPVFFYVIEWFTTPRGELGSPLPTPEPATEPPPLATVEPTEEAREDDRITPDAPPSP